ncbi:hypothetical protein [Streptomyces sp. 7N604]|uniref:hypothetical protein n=1 Tax=Streptomyces sp. 7N604 TaxID=3457415 RepID=UPI003FD36765
MLPKRVQRNVRERLGIEAKIGAWCGIGNVPEPPEEVHDAAGRGRLHPALMRPLAMLGTALSYPFKIVLIPLAWLDDVTNRIDETRWDREQRQAKAQVVGRRDAAIAQEGLDKVFDGDWDGAAGQFLLRWYSHSSHHRRLILLVEGRIVLLAPAKRVSVRVPERMRIVAEIPVGQAVIEDPLLGRYESNKLRMRFTDGSWLILNTEETPSDIHRWLKHLNELGAEADQASENDVDELGAPGRHRRR